MDDVVIAAWADELEAARGERVAIAPLVGRGLASVDDAYRVQAAGRALREAAGDRRVGWKVGMTSRAVQHRLGTESPDFGALFASTTYASHRTIDRGTLIAPRCEAELAFRLGRTIDPAVRGALQPDAIRRAISGIAIAIEIVDSRILGTAAIADAVADNLAHAGAVLGPFVALPDRIDPAALMLGLADGTRALTGVATDVQGPGERPGPLGTIAWLAQALADRGEVLQADDIILSGAVTPLLPLDRPARVTATSTGFGTLTIDVR